MITNYKRVVTSIGLVGSLTGCALTPIGSSVAPSTELRGQTQAPRAQISVVTSNSDTGYSILVYAMGNPKNKPPFCKINETNAVLGSPAVDADGNLWVPMSDGATVLNSVVVEYKPNCGKAILTLQDPYAQASGVAIAPNGTVYVANGTTGYGYLGDVLVYEQGKTTPSRFLGENDYFYPYAIGVDTSNNVFVSYDKGSSSGVLIFANGKGPGRPVKGLPTSGYGVPLIDGNGNLIITDEDTVLVSAPPYNSAPKKFALKGSSFQCSLKATQNNLACADQTHARVDVYDYPALKYRYSFSSGIGTAIGGLAQAPR